MSENEKIEEYHNLLNEGLSDAEARGTVWPEDPKSSGN